MSVMPQTEFGKNLTEFKRSQSPREHLFVLHSEPTRNDLRSLSVLGELEVIIGRNNDGRWVLIKGASDYVAVEPEVERHLDIVCHYHPPGTLLGHFPHLEDVIIAGISRITEIVIHADGLTRFTGLSVDPITQERPIPIDGKEFTKGFFEYVQRGKLVERYEDYELKYRNFLADAGVVLDETTWDQLPEVQPISTFVQNFSNRS